MKPLDRAPYIIAMFPPIQLNPLNSGVGFYTIGRDIERREFCGETSTYVVRPTGECVEREQLDGNSRCTSFSSAGRPSGAEGEGPTSKMSEERVWFNNSIDAKRGLKYAFARPLVEVGSRIVDP